MKKITWLDRIIRKWPVKIACILLALLLSQYYHSTLLEKRSLDVPLIIKNNGLLIPASAYPKLIKVSFWGDAKVIAPLRSDDIQASIDISGYDTPGKYTCTVAIEVRDLNYTREAIQISSSPESISLELEQPVVKRIPVSLSLTGVLPDGYRISETNIDPPFAEITGPERLVNLYQKIATDGVSVSEKKKPFTITTGLINSNPLINLQSEKTVSVTIVIERIPEIKTFHSSIIKARNVLPSMTVSFEPVSVRVRLEGPPDELKNIQKDRLFFISCEHLSLDETATLPIQVQKPPTIRIVDIHPADITVSTKKREGLGDSP